jgi:hypothetical protein
MIEVMDELTFRSRVQKIVEIAGVIEKLPPEIRAQAFTLLAPYVGESPSKAKLHDDRLTADKQESGGDDSDTRGAFFGRFDHSKPADNVKLIFAYWYSQFGNAPLSVKGLKAIADEVGLTIPDNSRMTVTNAQANSKSLFTNEGRGLWRPTVHGEAYLKETYSVRKGTSSPPQSDE